MNIGLYHFLHKHKNLSENILIKEEQVVVSQVHKSKEFCSFIDRGVYAVGILGVLVIIPQILKIWVDKDTNGVSIITWIGFFIGALFWLFYGIIHKEKPIILTNSAVLIADLLVIWGLLFLK
ncbi:hypothetical protein HYU93_03050 [Candidatus Daviesbacteria bacterium]|nr:hypothetical protein [Candidatus Daviesbacteria bacterium]